MKSIFLKLSSLRSGAARRHCPFRSIIHKPICFLFALVFFLLHCFLVPVSALAQPNFQPVIDTQLYQLPQFVDPLTDSQLDIFYFILGSQVVEYAGLSGYRIENPYSDPDSVGEWFKKIGIDLYNDVLESYVIVGAPVIAAGKWLKDLYANIAGAANFAGYFNNSSFSDFLNDVQTDGLSLQLYPSMFGALNQYFAYNNGLYNWQNTTNDWVSEGTYRTVSMDDTNSALYLNYELQYNPPYVRLNSSSSRYNYRFLSNLFSSFHNLFIDTSNHAISIVNDNGSYLDYSYYYNRIGMLSTNSSGVVTFNETNLGVLDLYGSKSYNSSDYSNLIELANDYFNNAFTSSGIYYFFSDFIDTVYYGSSWQNRVILNNSTNLNFDDNSLQDVLVPINETLLDIKGLLSDLLDTNDLKGPAIDNLTLPNGDPLPASQLQPISVAVELPESGIVIPEGLFGSSKGFIDYLWYMTKPLVQYTHDFLGTMWFDGVDGFDFSGPAPIVFGVITLGLIGGLIVKFLL